MPLILGIVFQFYIAASFIILISIAAGLVFCFAVFYFFPLSFRFQFGWLQGIFLMFLIFCGGALLTRQSNIKNNTNWFGNYYTDSSTLVLKIEEPPTEKEKSFKTIASVEEIINKGVHKKVIGNILVYFSKKDSTAIPTYGDKILIKGGLQTIKNAGNPGGFNYNRYMHFQQIEQQVYLKNEKFVATNYHQENPIYTFIFTARKKVIDIVQKNIVGDKKVTGIIEALLIGYKEDLDKDVVQAYSNTGVVHIIAISGMHLGLIYVVLVWLFTRLPFIKRFKILQVVLILSSLWLFSLITGGSASVLRSAVMFTCIIIGKTFFKQASIYNSLATSAFLLLCYNPFLLWDVGFQLSYAAVVGIVWLQKERGVPGPPIDDQEGPRLHDTREIEVLVALTKRLLTGTFGRALQNRDRVADPLHDPRPPRAEFLEREDLRAVEHRLRPDRRRREHDQCEQRVARRLEDGARRL